MAQPLFLHYNDHANLFVNGRYESEPDRENVKRIPIRFIETIERRIASVDEPPYSKISYLVWLSDEAYDLPADLGTDFAWEISQRDYMLLIDFYNNKRGMRS